MPVFCDIVQQTVAEKFSEHDLVFFFAVRLEVALDVEPRVWSERPNEFARGLDSFAIADLEDDAAEGAAFDVDVFRLNAFFVAVHEADNECFETNVGGRFVAFDHGVSLFAIIMRIFCRSARIQWRWPRETRP